MGDMCYLQWMQNPEPSVDFDTVANKKQQHEVNVGKMLKPWKTMAFSFLIDLINYSLAFHMFSAISNSFGFGGHNSVVAFSAFKPWSSSCSGFLVGDKSCLFEILVVTSLLRLPRFLLAGVAAYLWSHLWFFFFLIIMSWILA